MSRPVSGITLRIDELVLEGFPAGERHRIADALERELARLLAADGAPEGLLEQTGAPAIDGGAITVQRGGRPEATGAQIARAIYRSLGSGGARQASH